MWRRYFRSSDGDGGRGCLWLITQVGGQAGCVTDPGVDPGWTQGVGSGQRVGSMEGPGWIQRWMWLCGRSRGGSLWQSQGWIPVVFPGVDPRVDPCGIRRGESRGGSLWYTHGWIQGWIPVVYPWVDPGVDPCGIPMGGSRAGSLWYTHGWIQGWIPVVYPWVDPGLDPCGIPMGGSRGGGMNRDVSLQQAASKCVTCDVAFHPGKSVQKFLLCIAMACYNFLNIFS